MKIIKKHPIFTLILLCASLFAHAQNHVTGVVKEY